MTGDELGKALKKMLDGNLDNYRSALNCAGISEPYWKRVVELYASLGAEGKGVLLEAMRQSAIDGASTVLSVVDNVTTVGDAVGLFQLVYEGHQVEDTQEYFLEACDEGA